MVGMLDLRYFVVVPKVPEALVIFLFQSVFSLLRLGNFICLLQDALIFSSVFFILLVSPFIKFFVSIIFSVLKYLFVSVIYSFYFLSFVPIFYLFTLPI